MSSCQAAPGLILLALNAARLYNARGGRCMETRPGKLYTLLDTALAGVSAAVCAAMALAAALYILLDSPAHGAALAASGALLAAALCFAAGRIPERAARCGLIVFSAALILRVLAVLLLPSEPISDFYLLYSAAERAAGGDAGAFSDRYFALWGYQIPFSLYEALIIKLGGGKTALGLLNALWGALTAWLVYDIARRFAGCGPALAAGLAYAFYPGALLLTPVLTNQCISLAFMLLGIRLWLDGGPARAAAGGAALAFGNLMRPEAAIAVCGMLAALVLSLLSRSGKRRSLLTEALAFAAGYAALTLAANAAAGLSALAPNGIGSAAPEWKFVLGLDTETLGRYDASLAYILDIADAGERRAEALRAIRSSLDSCASLPLFFIEKAASFWGRYEDIWLGSESEPANLLRLAERAFFIAGTGLAAAGCLSRRGPAAETLARGAVFACFAAFLFIEVQPRYRYFVWPFVFILAAAGIKRLARRRRTGHWRNERV